MAKANVIIVGAGPGGLIAGMLLAKNGFDVRVFEKNALPGGRNSHLDLGGFKFDVGPTFLMMRFVLDDIFRAVGRKSEDYLEFIRLDPMYRLHFADKMTVDIFEDKEKMKAEIERHFPGQSAGLDTFMVKERRRFLKLFKCLIRDYSTPWSMLNKNILSALPTFNIMTTLYDKLGDYFKPERMRIWFTFQSKYLGMSPWKCPAIFTMIPYVEHKYGIFHTKGGLSEISAAMAKVVGELGGKIDYNTKVKTVLVEKGAAVGVELESGEKVRADAVFVNADFGYAATSLFPPGVIRKWTRARLLSKNYSVSTFMLYLGLDTVYDLPFHNILFAKDYVKNITDLEKGLFPEGNASFYVRNASKFDEKVAPPGMSNIYVLLPVANLKYPQDWKALAPRLRDWTLSQMEERLGMKDLRRHIVAEKVIIPPEWENDYNVFIGATFNLGHNLRQMLYWRPHNKFEEVRNCYIVGGGTHPGSGLPTIYESGVISADLLCRKYGISCATGINKVPDD
jgi:phytoene desaturase